MPEADTAVGMFKKDEEKLKKNPSKCNSYPKSINRFKVEVQ